VAGPLSIFGLARGSGFRYLEGRVARHVALAGPARPKGSPARCPFWGPGDFYILSQGAALAGTSAMPRRRPKAKTCSVPARTRK